MRTPAIKPKACKHCGAKFTPARPLQRVCGHLCAMAVGRAATEKKQRKEAAAERKATREKLQAMRKRPELLALAQTAINAWVRLRDADQPCISCSKPPSHEPNAWDAGHYRSVGSAPHMRFVEDNIHKQCKHCNQYLSGNHVAYRAGLIERIGLRAVELIEADQTLRKYTREGLVEIAKHYNSEAKRLRAEK